MSNGILPASPFSGLDWKTNLNQRKERQGVSKLAMYREFVR